jgi:hypothetical protein
MGKICTQKTKGLLQIKEDNIMKKSGVLLIPILILNIICVNNLYADDKTQ